MGLVTKIESAGFKLVVEDKTATVVVIVDSNKIITTAYAVVSYDGGAPESSGDWESKSLPDFLRLAITHPKLIDEFIAQLRTRYNTSNKQEIASSKPRSYTQ